MIDKDILTAGQRRIAAHRHLCIANEIIFDIAGYIHVQITENRYSSAVGSREETAQRGRGRTGPGSDCGIKGGGCQTVDGYQSSGIY